jgi:hypothetical protein
MAGRGLAPEPPAPPFSHPPGAGWREEHGGALRLAGDLVAGEIRPANPPPLCSGSTDQWGHGPHCQLLGARPGVDLGCM